MYVPSELRLIGRLAEDPVAAVSAAHDLGGEPALLVSGLTPLYPGDLEAYSRWAERLVRCARHPHIADVVTHGVGDGQPYVAVRTGKRRTLAEQLSGFGPLPYQAVRGIGIALADALATAHDAGLRHLAVKPSAIFVGDADGPVLVGFDADAPGLARPMAAGPLSAPEFHVPRGEIGGSGLVVGPPADVYALAGCLYLALGGVLPWGDRDDPPARGMPLPELPGVPPALTGVLGRAMAVHPVHRLTAAQLRDALSGPQPGSEPAPAPPAAGPADVLVNSALPAVGMPLPLQSVPGAGAAPDQDAARRSAESQEPGDAGAAGLRPLAGMWRITADTGEQELLTVDEHGAVIWTGSDESGPFTATGEALPLGGSVYRLLLNEPAGSAGFYVDVALEGGGLSFVMSEGPEDGAVDVAATGDVGGAT
ncbi:MAG: hypothetical protein ACRDT6_18120 [Micromonosporaceae bacterium]